MDPSLDAIAERVRAVALELDDAASALRAYLDGIEAEPGRLEEVEERLQALDRLKRKHGGSVEAVLAHAERCRVEIERLESAEELRGGARAAPRARPRQPRAELAAELAPGQGEGRRRARAAGSRSELAELAMDGASLEVSLEPHPEGFGPNGSETVELRVATNPGIPPSPLRDAASGGELSRIMLALTGLGPGAGAGTLVFDEIDAGIGGNTARAVGERLRRLGSERQVICITHLPQVASLAEAHFRIEKRASRRPRDGNRGPCGRRRAGGRDRPHAWCASATTRPRAATPASCWLPRRGAAEPACEARACPGFLAFRSG